ncbi:MAG: CPXCG motif-containing cysteine-rich protein [Xanthomonadales bacterium]|nr:CPXCG motif-containing cysteine-rich protein [Xanthomonadales bacterium]NNL96113.1 CPXCG motif-containing cysteine-rich protein [Xanthomonadales bacterium]
MNLDEHDIACPYCGETISILVDPSVLDQQYVEDCQVCCRPIEMTVQVQGDGEFRVEARHEDQ